MGLRGIQQRDKGLDHTGIFGGNQGFGDIVPNIGVPVLQVGDEGINGTGVSQVDQYLRRGHANCVIGIAAGRCSKRLDHARIVNSAQNADHTPADSDLRIVHGGDQRIDCGRSDTNQRLERVVAHVRLRIIQPGDELMDVVVLQGEWYSGSGRAEA